MSLQLAWSDEQEFYPISEEMAARLEQLLQLAGAEEHVTDGEVALTFVDDEAIREINKQYRGLDKPTDVLSFAMQEMGEGELEIVYDEDADDDELRDVALLEGEEPGDEETFEEPLGDIIISVPRAVAQAEEYGHSVERELGFLFVHGFLHLVGYDHQDEAEEKRMFAKQEAILHKAGLTR